MLNPGGYMNSTTRNTVVERSFIACSSSTHVR
jgi:hypothetical protein